jgi:hypothetical protein
MFTFYRRIRKALLDSNQARKYFIYAAGEVLLVMIGILLALQVNNWNEWRKDRNAEDIILESLLFDMESNKRQIKRKIEGTKRSVEEMIAKRKFLLASPDAVSDADLDTLIGVMNMRSSFDPNVGTLNELLNSGSIRVINNGDLRKMISSWSSNMDEVREEEDLADITLNEFLIPYLMEHSSMADWMSLNSNYGGKLNFRNHFKGDKSKILTDLYFENLINYSISRRKWAIRRYSNMEEYIQEMIDLIRDELNGAHITPRPDQ